MTQGKEVTNAYGVPMKIVDGRNERLELGSYTTTPRFGHVCNPDKCNIRPARHSALGEEGLHWEEPLFSTLAKEDKERNNGSQPRMRRIWAMPHPLTFTIKPIKELILNYMNSPVNWFDPFAGSNPFSLNYSNDSNPECPTTFHMDAVEFLHLLEDYHRQFDGALFDPPYTLHQTNQVYKGYGLRKPISLTKDLIAPLIKTGGYVLCFGHNSGGMGINRGFELLEVLLVPHGGSHDDTICTVEKKK